MFDILIKNGTVYDGSGAPSRQASIAITGERIAEIIEGPGQASPEAQTVIDASGRIVCPGFVDAHSHSDFNVLVDPYAESKLRQGITTEIVGNCGAGAFPLAGSILEEESEAAAKLGLNVDWHDVEGYRAVVERAQPAVNLATFVGHTNIRCKAIGDDDRLATPSEMRMMKYEVEKAMEEGALGLSTGLIYAPGMFADVNELVELQEAAAKHGGIYSSHIRSEGDRFLEATQEFLQVVRGAECQGQLSHLKASGPRNWGKVAQVMEQIEQVNASGGCIRFDKYPYIASSTSLRSLLPRWVLAGGREQALSRVMDVSQRAQILNDSCKNNEGRDMWNSILICDAGCEEFREFQGDSLGQIAEKQGKTPEDLFFELLIKSRMSTSICNFTMSQEETDMALTHPLGMVCSDSACRKPSGPLSQDSPHPRSYGTYGKFFRDYVKERPLLKLEEAIRKATSLPCDTYGLRNRGQLKKGYVADVLVIDWEHYEDRADYAHPHRLCTGVDAIIVNGCPTVLGGEITSKRAGRLLSRGA